MNKEERELDLLVAELGSEVRMLIAQNETLKQNLDAANAERLQFKAALERIMSVSRVALWDGRPQGVKEVGPQARTVECND